MRLRSVVAPALLSGLLAGLLSALPVAPVAVPAYAADCPAVTLYPGDSAPKAAIAAWMARGASARGIPGELPVMAALVESDLVNLRSGNADAQGYFQMRTSIWSGAYPGFADDPELQLDWFLDQAAAVRTPPYPGEESWGEWAADVERPAPKYRYRYQLRLDEARSLIGPPCDAPDTLAPQTDVAAPARQRVAPGHGIRVSVACPAEPCTADVRGRVLLGDRPRLAASPRTLAPGQDTRFRLRLAPGVHRLVARALRRHAVARVRVTVTTTDAAGNASRTTASVRITG